MIISPKTRDAVGLEMPGDSNGVKYRLAGPVRAYRVHRVSGIAQTVSNRVRETFL